MVEGIIVRPETEPLASIEKMKLRKRLEEALEESAKKASWKYVCLEKDYYACHEFEDFERGLFKTKFINGGVYVFAPGKPHQDLAARFSNAISDALFDFFGRNVREIFSFGSRPIRWFNFWSCGRIISKSMDFGLFRQENSRPVIAGEVAFGHETLGDLIIEGLNYLTSFTHVNLFFGVFIGRNRIDNDFSITVFLLRRSSGNVPNPQNINLIEDLEHLSCPNNLNSAAIILADLEDPNEFNVLLAPGYPISITRQQILNGEGLTLNLPLAELDLGIPQGNLEIPISNQELLRFLAVFDRY